MVGDDDEEEEAETWIGVVAMEGEKVVLNWEYLREEKGEEGFGKCPESP